MKTKKTKTKIDLLNTKSLMWIRKMALMSMWKKKDFAWIALDLDLMREECAQTSQKGNAPAHYQLFRIFAIADRLIFQAKRENFTH